jgi:hypothetical protein
MEELGWETLEARRSSQRTVLMFKIQHFLAPQYLNDICPPLVGEVSNYYLRNADNIALPMGRRTGYVNSFMPSAVRLWNGLENDIKKCNSLESFKYNLKKAKNIKKVKLYSKFNGNSAVNHTRMRLGLSGLKSQRFDYNHVDNRRCDFCGSTKDDPMHYLLQCSVFATMHTTMLNWISDLYQSKNINLDLRRTIVQKELVKCMLHGDKRLSEGENVDLFRTVQQFIGKSNRF